MGKTVAVLATAVVAVVLGGALLLGSGPSGGGACAGTATTAVSAAKHAPVAGYAGDQLANAAAVINAGAALKVPAAGITIGVMTAMGESGLRNLTYGDAAGPDSRGLFQQRASWGTLTERLNPGAAATAFYRRLLAVPGWQSMPPARAAHVVQGNADPDHYTPYWKPAQQVVAALTGGTAACAADLLPRGNAQAIARQLQAGIEAGTITGLVPDHLREITWIAEGRTVPDCGIDPRILQVIYVAWRTFGTIGISDINRHCTGQIAGAGTESSHWINGGGHAVDFYSLGGASTNGGDANAIRLLRVLDPAMPDGARVGQIDCRPSTVQLAHLIPFSDHCDHLHIDVAYATASIGLHSDR